MEDNSAFAYQKEKSFSSILASFLFSHVGLFFLVAGYAAFGAWAFVELESPAELQRYSEKVRHAQSVEDMVDVTVKKIWWNGENYKGQTENYTEKTRKDLMKMEKNILKAVLNHDYDGQVDSWNFEWTFMNCLLLTMSIMTTIGYGHISPKTFEGQIFCIVYAMVGCPLFLVFLANIGDAMAKGFIYMYSRCCCRAFRSRRYLEEIPEGHSKKYRKLVMDDVVGEEPYMPTSQLFVPITLSVVVLHGFIILGGILFSYWEDWGQWSSYYFTFITLSTIGYGDLVPGRAFLGASSITATLKMLVSVTYIVVGMALLSMCITLMQEQIIQKCRWAAKKIGFSKDDSVRPAGEDCKEGNTLKPPMEPPIPGSSPFRRPSTPMDLDLRGPEEKLPGSF